MEYRQLGRSGLQVSAVGLGANPFGNEVDADTAKAIVSRAIDLGINYFDTANTYNDGRSEEILGRALGDRRREIVLGTKAGGVMAPGPNQGGASRKHLVESVEASLRRLSTDWVDVFHIHHPDPRTPSEETMRALDDLIRAGKIRYIGCSNYADWQIVESQRIAMAEHLTPFVSCQPPYNLLNREIERSIVPLCERYGLGVIPYFPLAGGFLTGLYRRGEPLPPGSRGANRPSFARWTSIERNWDLLEQLEAFAKERGHTITELAMAWLLSRPIVRTIIAGADVPEHVEANVRAAEWQLTPEDLTELDRITL
jgi:aryl-alcohol dehydrogenase-like predicted oxidoreductase